MSRPFRLLALALLALSLAQPAAAQRRAKAAAAANAEMLTQSCFACHGAQGASIAAPIPTIGGQSSVYLFNTLKAFKEQTRPATVMTRLMKAYSEVEINAIADTLARKPFVRAEQATDPAKVELGQRVYQRVCQDCHKQGGREPSEPDYPILAGQWLPYMQATMADIVAGKRIVDEKFFAALGKVSRDELDAVLHYFAAQR